jgi:hypothetical protein
MPDAKIQMGQAAVRLKDEQIIPRDLHRDSMSVYLEFSGLAEIK